MRKELSLTGRWLNGPEAERYGLALRSVPLDQLDAETEALLAQLRNKPRGSVGVAKAMMEANRFRSGRDAVDGELSRFLEWAKGDLLAAEGMRAFVEKGEPVWVQEASGTPA